MDGGNDDSLRQSGREDKAGTGTFRRRSGTEWNAAADFYSFIFTGDTGTAFPLEGKITDIKDTVYATQAYE